jgi:integrase
MASIFQKRETRYWWVKFTDPATGQTVRKSLNTPDQSCARLMLKKLEAHLVLRDPVLAAIDLPVGLVGANGRPACQEQVVPGAGQSPTPASGGQSNAPVQPQVSPLEVVVRDYLNWCRAENSAAHYSNKASILRKFWGTEVVPYPAEVPKRTPVKAACGKRSLTEITVMDVQTFIEQAVPSMDARRHYRETFHQFYEYAIKNSHVPITNFYCPNPMGNLPSYVQHNREIVFLDEHQIDVQLAALAAWPTLQSGVDILINAGLRRNEMVWLKKTNVNFERGFISVVLNRDYTTNRRGSLKTQARPVTLSPQLAGRLRSFFDSNTSEWAVPSPTFGQWHKDNFSDALRQANQAAKLSWNCHHFRHTYATARLSEGWSLFRLSKEMGNSVPTLTAHYAGWIRPDSLFGK